MSRRSRAGTAEKPPSVEETLGRLEVKLKELELKYELRECLGAGECALDPPQGHGHVRHAPAGQT